MKKLLYILLSLILLLSTVSCQNNEDRPTSVTETFYGCEFSITLDKSKYDLGDTVKATVSLVNKNEQNIGLYSPTLNPYFTILFSEDGIFKFGDDFLAGDTMFRRQWLDNNEGYTYTKEYDLTSPEGTESLLKTDSEWKIKATGTVVIDIDGEEKHNDISLEIVVPH